MNIKNSLLREHSKNNTLTIVQYISNDKIKFKKLMAIFLSNDFILSQRAAWCMSYCVENYPELLKPYIKRILDNLHKKPLHDAVVRNTVRCLQYVDVPEKLLGYAYDCCFKLLTSREIPIATKAFSMTVLYNICNKEPGLKNELISVLEREINHESAGYKSRAKKTIAGLKKLIG